MTLPDIDDLASLGGAKVNYAPLEDVTTDLDADQDNAARADTAALTHTATRAWARITTAATTGAMILVAHDSVWGNAALYAPTLARTSTGLFTVTWPASVPDELGVFHSVNLRAALQPSYKGATEYRVSAEITSANVLTLRVRDSAGALNDAVGVDFNLFTL